MADITWKGELDIDTTQLKKGVVEINDAFGKVTQEAQKADSQLQSAVKGFTKGWNDGAKQISKVAATMGKTLSMAFGPVGIAIAAVTAAFKLLSAGVKEAKERVDAHIKSLKSVQDATYALSAANTNAAKSMNDISKNVSGLDMLKEPFIKAFEAVSKLGKGLDIIKNVLGVLAPEMLSMVAGEKQMRENEVKIGAISDKILSTINESNTAYKAQLAIENLIFWRNSDLAKNTSARLSLENSTLNSLVQQRVELTEMGIASGELYDNLTNSIQLHVERIEQYQTELDQLQEQSQDYGELKDTSLELIQQEIKEARVKAEAIESEYERVKAINGVIDMEESFIRLQGKANMDALKASEEYKHATGSQQRQALSNMQKIIESQTRIKDLEKETAKESYTFKEYVGEINDLKDKNRQLDIKSIEDEKERNRQNNEYVMQRSAAMKVDRDMLKWEQSFFKVLEGAVGEYTDAEIRSAKLREKEWDEVSEYMQRVFEKQNLINDNTVTPKVNVEKLGQQLEAGAQYFGDFSSSILSITQNMADEQIAIIQEKLEKLLEELNAARQQALEDAGFLAKTSEEGLEEAMQAAIDSGDEQRVYLEKRRQEELKINKNFDAKEKAAKEQAAKEIAKIEYEQAMAQWKMQVAMVPAQIAAGIMQAVSQSGLFGAVAGSIIIGAVGAAQLAAILSAEPKKQFAKGGVFEDGKQVFAQGGAFTNGIINTPTDFNIGQMGENGSEAIIPLAEMSDGSLGVTMAGRGVPEILNINLMLDGEIIATSTVDLVNRNQTPPLKGLWNGKYD